MKIVRDKHVNTPFYQPPGKWPFCEYMYLYCYFLSQNIAPSGTQLYGFSCQKHLLSCVAIMGNDVWKLHISSQTQMYQFDLLKFLSDDIICNLHWYLHCNLHCNLHYILLHIYNVEIVKLQVWGSSQRVKNLTMTTIDPYNAAY